MRGFFDNTGGHRGRAYRGARQAAKAGAGLAAAVFFWLGLAAAATAQAAPDDVFAELAESGADIILLGEVHDNPAHHLSQDRAIAAIDPGAIVFEMLTAEQAARVTPEIAGDAAALAAALDWQNSGWPDFAMYYPLLARAADIPIYGAGVPRAEASRAFDAGAAAVFGDGAALFGLTEPLPAEEQAEREAEQMEVHCNALPEDVLPGFVEAQRLRDAALAAAALDAREATGGPVVVITGNGHARADWGVPALLARAAPGLEVLALGQFEADPGEDAPFGLWIVAEPVDRPDPCAAFR